VLQHLVRLLVFGDMGIDEAQIAADFAGIGLLDAGLAGPQRLDLGSDQNDARFHRGIDEILVPRAAVLRDHLVFGRGRH